MIPVTCERGWRDVVVWIENWLDARKKRRAKIKRARVFFDMP